MLRSASLRLGSLLLPALLLLSACGRDQEAAPEDPATSEAAQPGAVGPSGLIGAEEAIAEGDRYGMFTREGSVKLGLTDEVVYVALSKDVVREVDREIKNETEDLGEFGAAIANAVREGVTSMLQHQLELPIDDIRDIRYEDGRLVVDLEDGSERLDNFKVDGEPIETQFNPDEARRFAEEFRAVKAARS